MRVKIFTDVAPLPIDLGNDHVLLVEIDSGMQHGLPPRLTAGAPFIKIYTMLAPKMYRALAERTRTTSPATRSRG